MKAMKLPEDAKTGELLLGEHKRDPSRPPADNPKSAAERARLYRERKKAGKPIKSDENTVTENKPAPKSESVGMLESRIVLLNATLLQRSDELDAARDRIAALDAELKSVTRHK